MSYLASFSLTLFIILVIGILVMFVLLTRVKRGESDRLMVITGWVGKGRSAIIRHGGLCFIWPVIQRLRYLSLQPHVVNIKLDGALSKENIRVSLPCTFIIGVDSTNLEVMQAAATRIIDIIDNPREFSNFVQELVFGQMRAVVSSMTIEEINNDRQRFQEHITDSVSKEISKVGLSLISVNIQDIRDEADFIKNLGQKAAAEARAKAQISIAEQERIGATGESENAAQQRAVVAENNFKAIDAENKASQNIAISTAELERIQKEAAAKNASQADITVSNATKEARMVEADNNVAVYRAQTEAKKAEVELAIEQSRLDSEPLAKKMIIEESGRGQAEGERKRKFMEEEAKGITAIFNAKAAGIEKVMKAAGNDPMAALLLSISDDIPGIMGQYAKAISERKIDNLVCIGGGENGDLGGLTRQLLNQVPGVKAILESLGFQTPFLKEIEAVKKNIASVEESVAENNASLHDKIKNGARKTNTTGNFI